MEYLISLTTDPTAWAALVTLTVMEVVLGIDNLIFISILTNELPDDKRATARRIGILFALVLRLSLLVLIAMIVRLTDPIIVIFAHAFSWKDLILIAGGIFLLWKATKEIHHHVSPEAGPDSLKSKVVTANVAAVIVQILILDLIFSVDSIVTAVGMTPHIPIMVIAVLITVAIMLVAADPLGEFIHANPTVIMLALGFLLLIGTTLIAEGFGFHLPKGYIYAAMGFSALVESFNILAKRAKAR